MYMGRVQSGVEREVLNELRGARILITGLSAISGVDVARTFAGLAARLVIHTTDLSPEITALISVLSENAGELRVYSDPITPGEHAIRFAQMAAEAYGGLDAVINFATIARDAVSPLKTEQDVEALVSHALSPLAHLTRVTANRMRVVFSEGVILNVLTMPEPGNAREAAVAAFARTTLAAMTSIEARAWANEAIRINGVGPKVADTGGPRTGACLTNEPDIAALAIYLASKRGRTLSGHVFDCEAG